MFVSKRGSDDAKFSYTMYWGLIIIVIALLIWVVYAYNRLVKNRNRMQEAWSIIDVFLKKRYEIIPLLVNTVKGYAIHEQRLLEEVTRLRVEAMNASGTQDKVISENQLGKAADRLFLNIENYPELKADKHFLMLQHQLSDLENDLEKARRYYNGTVRENNIYQESVPSNLIASLFRFSKGVFFTTNEKEKDVTQVEFNK